MQIDGRNDDVMSLRNAQEKFAAFGWNTSFVDGSDITGIISAIENGRYDSETPLFIVLDTVKGAGVPCIEKLSNNHCIGVSQALAEKAIDELNEQARALGLEATRWN